MILNVVVMVEEGIRQGKGKEENKLKICTGFSHLFFFFLDLKAQFFYFPNAIQNTYLKGVKF